MGKLRIVAGVAAAAAAMGTAGILSAPAANADAAPCSAQADACIALSSNAAWLMDDGVVTYGSVPLTSGRPGYRTPPGVFHVSYKDIDHWSQKYDAPMPFSVFFNGGIAFHEGSLEEQSHGCVHLSREAASTFYSALEPGDVVEVIA